MNFFTFCWSAIPAQVHLFAHPSWESFYLGMLCLRVVQKGSPPTSRTDHQPPLSLLTGLCSASRCLPEWWLAQEEVAWDGSSPVHGPQDQRGKDHLTPSFPSLRKKAHTHLWLISLPKQYSSANTSDSFSGVFGFFSKTDSMYSIRTQFCAEDVSIAACTRAMARAGSAASSCDRTCCFVTPKQAVGYIPGKVLQQNQHWFVFTSAVQTWCKWKQSSLSPAL